MNDETDNTKPESASSEIAPTKVQISFTNATTEQLRKFAKDVLGLAISPNPNTKPETIVAAIRKAWQPPYIEFDADDEVLKPRASPKPPAAAKPAVGAHGMSERVRLIAKLHAMPNQPYTKIEIDGDGGDRAPMSLEDLRKVTSTYWVVVERQEREDGTGDSPVMLSFNGRAVMVLRGEAFPLSYGAYNSLKNAVMDVYDPLKDGGISTTPRKVPRYPWRTAMDDEIAMFKRLHPEHPAARAA